mgnify:CR=1 FL=1|tara:strand:- start:14 stop:229 length:216 start_codon:yes stop_codon:yes gene_type:complete
MLRELQQWIETILTPNSGDDMPPTQEVEESKEAPPTQEADDKKDLTYFFPTKEVDVKDGMKKREPLFNFFL